MLPHGEETEIGEKGINMSGVHFHPLLSLVPSQGFLRRAESEPGAIILSFC